MHFKPMLFAAVAVICLGLIHGTQVRADSMDSFVYKFDGNTFNWQLPSSPAPPASLVTLGSGFGLYPVSVFENGGPAISPGEMDFFSASQLGGLVFFMGANEYFNLTGPQLYSGSENSPTFRTGAFPVSDFNTGDPAGVLKISGVSTSVPEPSALLLLLIALGFALVISIARKLAPCGG
jgi:PEP-CTERM motif